MPVLPTSVLRRLRAAVVGASLFVLAGCGSLPTLLPTATPTTTTSPSAVPSTLPSPNSAPAGSTLRTVDSLHLRLAVPDGWVVLDAAAGAKDPDLVRVAAAMKTPPSHVVDVLRASHVVKLVPADAADISITAVDLRILKRRPLPDSAQMSGEITAFGGSPGDLAPVPTPLGPAVRVPYVLERGSSTSACEILVADDGSRLVSVSTAMPTIPLVEALTTLVETTVTSTT